MTLSEYREAIEAEQARFFDWYYIRFLEDPQTYPAQMEMEAWDDVYADWFQREE